MARRLIEAGTRCVMVTHNNWDTHFNNFHLLKTLLLPQLNSGLGTLVRDLADRGLLETTMIVAMGEFGRTPRINSNADATTGVRPTRSFWRGAAFAAAGSSARRPIAEAPGWRRHRPRGSRRDHLSLPWHRPK